MKITFRLWLGIVVLFLHVATHAREVTAFILSVPAGATITDGAQPKPKLLGKAPLRITVEVDNIDYKAGVLQEGRYSAKWSSGAISRVLKYASPLGESEFVYVIERPIGAEGETKDQTAGQAHAKKHDVAAMTQEIEAKYKAFEEKVTMLREKQKEEAQLAEEQRQQDIRLAEGQRQRKMTEAFERDKLAASERRIINLKKRQEEAKETLEKRSNAVRAHYLPLFNPNTNRLDWEAGTRRGDAYARDTAGQYERERACVRDLNRCDY